MTSYPPTVLRDYSLLADGERAAVIGPRGDIVWLCVPQWHSPAAFSALIGGNGAYAVTPTDPRFVWGGYYEPGTLIWRSRWVTTTGIIECREALAFPGDADRAVILRRVRAVDGPAEVDVVLDVRSDFDHHAMTGRSQRDGVWTARSGSLSLRWTGQGSARARKDGSEHSRLVVEHGDHHDLVLELGARSFDGDPPDAEVLWSETESAWARAVPELDDTLAPRDARHAYAVLRGLTASTGAMVAAATTSLPERADHGRNYDYRYAWIRDQCYTGQAVAECGPLPLLDGAVRFVADRLLDHGAQLDPAYTINGEPVPQQFQLGLAGYPGGSDTIGNWVTDQFQLDAFGEVLLLFAAAGRLDRLDSDHWRAVETAVSAIEQRWKEPDAGIWEIDPNRWAHSRLICAAGLRAASAVATAGEAARWEALADTLVADAAGDCIHPSGRWQRAPDDERVDVALLLPALRGAVPPDDRRSIATLDAVVDDLTQDGYVYRFRHDQRPLNEAEGAFLLCGFQTALAEHQQGRREAALRRFERNRAACGSPGLLTEEFDVVERQLRGNLPQAFVHALLLESAHRLADAD